MSSLSPKPYRVMLLEEGSTTGPVIQDCAETLVGAARALGFSEGFDAGDPNPYFDTYWIEELVDDEWKKVDLDFIEP